jgi:hypothetical protein
MHPLFQKASGLTETIIAAAIEVYRDEGAGLIEREVQPPRCDRAYMVAR